MENYKENLPPEFSSIEQETKALRLENLALKREIQDAVEDLLKLQEMSHTMKLRHLEDKNRYEQPPQSFHFQVEELENELRSLQTSLQEMSEENMEIKADQSNLITQIAQQEKENEKIIEDLRKQVQLKTEDISREQRENEDRKTVINNTRQMIHKLTADIEGHDSPLIQYVLLSLNTIARGLLQTTEKCYKCSKGFPLCPCEPSLSSPPMRAPSTGTDLSTPDGLESWTFNPKSLQHLRQESAAARLENYLSQF